MGNIVEIKNLYKNYGQIRAVTDLSFCVKEGELFAFLGVNGAGKSTTINIMCTQLHKDSGQIIIDGFNLDDDAEKIKNIIGVVFQNSVLDYPLTVKDNLESRAALYGIVGDEFTNRLNELTEMFSIRELLNRKLGSLSGGQKRRIDIARALIHNPKILFLDEPTTGLDPQTRKIIWNVISNLRKTNKMTVFLTTHYMEEAADADYVVIIDDGKIAAKGTPNELKNRYTGDYITVYSIEEAKVKELGIKYEYVSDGFRIFVQNTAQATDLITKYPHIFIDYEVIKGKMDDVFLFVTGKKLVGGEIK